LIAPRRDLLMIHSLLLAAAITYIPRPSTIRVTASKENRERISHKFHLGLPSGFARRLANIHFDYRFWPKMILAVTAYVTNASAHGCTINAGRTATGTIADVGTVAIDPHLFPMGTRFYVPGYGYGVGTDTGGAIHGRHIDVAMRSCSSAIAWGRRNIIVSFTH